MSLLSRVAERIYWTARYLERAETTSRLARVYGNLLLDLPREAGLSWDVLVQITGGADRYRELHPSPVRRCSRAILRRRSRQPELGALVARVGA